MVYNHILSKNYANLIDLNKMFNGKLMDIYYVVEIRDWLEILFN